jgi:predicted flap endonuclease-1-like 5' DNA nuclease
MTNGSATQAIDVPTTSEWLTATNLVLIAVGVVLALIVILWGARAKRARKAADQAIAERAATQAPPPIDPAPSTDVDMASAAQPAPAAPIAEPIAEPRPAPPPSEPVIETPPVAPAPPPLAGDDTPVVAAAPYDATPASIAADLATPDTAPTEAGSGDDDLTQLKGVGPKLAARLADLGYTRFDQIAALDDANAAALDAQLGTFQGRMSRDRWIEQAGYLARGDRAGFEGAFGKL